MKYVPGVNRIVKQAEILESPLSSVNKNAGLINRIECERLGLSGEFGW